MALSSHINCPDWARWLFEKIKEKPMLFINCTTISALLIAVAIFGNPVNKYQAEQQSKETIPVKNNPSLAAFYPKESAIKEYRAHIKEQQALKASKNNLIVNGSLDPKEDILALSDDEAGSETLPPMVKKEAVTANNKPLVPINAETIDTSIGKGGTLAKSLMKLGLSGGEANAAIQALIPVFNVRKLRAEDRIIAVKTDFIQEIQVVRGLTERYQISRPNPQSPWEASRINIATQKEQKVVHGLITSSLYQALADAGESAGLAAVFADIFSWEIDFFHEVRSGDKFTMVIERELVDGQVNPRSTKILAASYDGMVGKFQAFRKDPQKDAFYDENGNSLRKAFLRAPLKFPRVTSNYGNRRHPALGFNRKHDGIDYGTPVGTDVLSVADGTVLLTANQPNGAGKYVKIRYPNGYEGIYMHLSQIKVKKGDHVKQGDVIALSGNTGLSTGPHLHYGLKKNGTYINPATEKFPRGNALAAADKVAFKAIVDRYLPLLQNMVPTTKANTNTVMAGLEE